MSYVIRRPLFADLIFDEQGQIVKTVYIGAVPHYVVPDGDFQRHVEAEHVDRQIVRLMQERILAMRDFITAGVIQMLGREDLFTQASIEHAIKNMDRILEPGNVDVDELRTTLWMLKFRAIVNVHGDVVRLDVPGWEEEEI